jgi:hypothetical protein
MQVTAATPVMLQFSGASVDLGALARKLRQALALGLGIVSAITGMG